MKLQMRDPLIKSIVKADLIIAYNALAVESAERQKQAADLAAANSELAYQNCEKEKRAAELVIANKKLAFEIEEKGKRAAELIIANKELAFLNDEKEKRAIELIIANKELAFQNAEKEKRAIELGIAHNELIFESDEKGKRAAELAVANIELAFQNGEKERMAVELIVANKELSFQNAEKERRAIELEIAHNELIFESDEKGKRAAELAVANIELAFQNGEKERKAVELIVANKELAFQNNEKEKRANELTVIIDQLKTARDNIRVLNEGLEQKVKERTEQLQIVNKELESFSYAVSHDLRSPLTVIAGFTEIIKDQYGKELSGGLMGMFDHIESSAKRMTRIVKDLLDLAIYGQEKLKPVPIPMTEFFQKIWEQVTVDMPVKPLLELSIMPTVMADESVMEQVVVNLLSNAIKYSSKCEQPVVSIGSQMGVETNTFFVKDNGVGFDMKQYNRLFGAFQRLHRQTDFEGTGVGLLLVKRIIEKHGGNVWAESKVGEGVTFYFTIPI